MCLYDADGRITGHVGIQRDVTERKQTEIAMRTHYEMALALNENLELDQALNLILDAVCQLESIDSGGIYLPNPVNGVLELAAHRGLSTEFVAHTAYFGPDAPQPRLVRAGQSIYSDYIKIRPAADDIRAREGLRAIAVLPVLHQGELLLVLNLASRTHAEIPAHVRATLKTLALQIGGALARVQASAALADSRRNLQTLFDSIDELGIKDFHSLLLCRWLGPSPQALTPP